MKYKSAKRDAFYDVLTVAGMLLVLAAALSPLFL